MASRSRPPSEGRQIALNARRILIYGVTGAGKTTLARNLSERTGIPWHSVDDLAWNPGWEQVLLEQQIERIIEITNGDSWILDTAYAKWVDIPLARVQLIVGLDYPRWLSLGRLTNRTVRRLFDKKPICNGNLESLKTFFSKDAILLWHFQSFARKRDRMRAWKDEGRDVVLLKTQKEADQFLSSACAELDG